SRVALRVTGTTVGPREIDQPLELASYAQFLNDPNIIKIQFLVTAFLVLFRLLQAIMAQLDATFFGPRRQQ
ncbi:MAG TPA: hypothetical protein VFF31_25880, partial [Blastocatellia bacterium]|nr:hypothetical protein [Blastocatellia bacterium]